MQSLKQANKTGLWVQCQGENQLLDSKSGTDTVLKLVDKHGISDVFLQVFRTGRTWFSSQVFESGNINSALIELLKELHRRNITAHAWVNICNAGVSASKKFLDLIGGKAALLQDNHGRDSQSSLAPYEIDTAGVWLEPSNPQLIAAINSLTLEISKLDFSGIHLDFIRYPYCLPIRPASWIDCGLDFGYSQPALDNFNKTHQSTDVFCASKHGGILPKSESLGQIFDSWRRLQIENLIKTVKQASPEAFKLSVAALAWSDRAYLNAYQDWRNWLSQNLIDSLCLMTYSADTKLITQQINQAKAFLNPGQTLFAGIGLYKLSSLDEFAAQHNAISDLGVNPCYFCADRLLSSPA